MHKIYVFMHARHDRRLRATSIIQQTIDTMLFITESVHMNAVFTPLANIHLVK